MSVSKSYILSTSAFYNGMSLPIYLCMYLSIYLFILFYLPTYLSITTTLPPVYPKHQDPPHS